MLRADGFRSLAAKNHLTPTLVNVRESRGFGKPCFARLPAAGPRLFLCRLRGGLSCYSAVIL
jgi:hypothetical protein